MDESPGGDPPIVKLVDAAHLDRKAIGGKAATLGVLAAAGLPVPGGFVVPAGAEPTPDELHRAAGEVGGGLFAVRSSAVAEDLADASFAGLYETYLNVPPGEIPDAVRRCRASARAERVRAYRGRRDDPRVAVLVQRMVDADAAGVAFTANPVTGARDETVITAVPGLAESLVSGEAVGEEWIVRRRRATLTRRAATPTRPAATVLDAERASTVADLARRVHGLCHVPQDVEWAMVDGVALLLQARPMTALPEPVAWEPPGAGLWLRGFRLGEWLPDPVTPLFADWLLPRIDEGFHAGVRDTTGARLSFAHGIVNGWYYTRPTPALRMVPGALLRSRGGAARFAYQALIRPGRDPVAADRALLGGLYRRWREELLPAYRKLAARDVPGGSTAEVAGLVDEIGRTAGRHLWYLAVVGGAAWKMEARLGAFMRRSGLGHIDPQLLLRDLPANGDEPPEDRAGMTGPGVRQGGDGVTGTGDEPATRSAGPVRADVGHARADDRPAWTGDGVVGHAVFGIDWYNPTAAESGLLSAPATQGRRRDLARRRAQAEDECRRLLADRPRRLAAFTAMARTARRYAAIREEQARELTLGWPLLRACALRIGAGLTAAGMLDDPTEVFFLTRAEIDHIGHIGDMNRQARDLSQADGDLGRPAGDPSRPDADQGRPDADLDRAAGDLGRTARRRRAAWEAQRGLAAPLFIGTAPPIIGRHLERTLGLRRDGGDDALARQSVLTGQPAATGRATGPVRIVRDLDDFGKVADGDVLVARATAPAWTPLFGRVAAVVTDGGTLAAHASLIAREYGLPAVVATGDATLRLRDGQIVTVDGTRGIVQIVAP